MKRLVLFGVLIDTKAWIEALLASDAPCNDLILWNELSKFEEIDPEMAKALKEALYRHFWYLSDKIVGLALFSDNASAPDKASIVVKLTDDSKARTVRGNSTILKRNINVQLTDFTTKRTAPLFKKHEINTSFLEHPPDSWKTQQAYLLCQERVQKLRVVNDTAERGVKLFEDFNKHITNEESEKKSCCKLMKQTGSQFLLMQLSRRHSMMLMHTNC